MTTFYPVPSPTSPGEVTEFDGQIAELAETLFEIMQSAGGVALAASAIGRPERLVVVDLPDAAGMGCAMALVNPRLTAVHDGLVDQAAVFPGSAPALRFARIDVTFETLEGDTVTLAADGPLAIGLQAQIDLLTNTAPARHLH
ncbi:peptide deformylase [Tropicibacter sp. S64]|uniref:peptide deformylase n=1 Tax=Tropicibacter sp. S64 TaxID=3415122 RepID=UPI003C7AD838